MIIKDIPGYEGRYQATDDGQVFSFHCRRFLRPGRMPSGHLSVMLGRSGGSQCVHKLMLITFVGPPPPKHECRHLDGNPANNRLENLAWGTRSQNIQDVKHHQPGRGRLSAKRVRKIKRDLQTMTIAQAARKHDLSTSAAHSIKHGRYHRDM